MDADAFSFAMDSLSTVVLPMQSFQSVWEVTGLAFLLSGDQIASCSGHQDVVAMESCT